MIDKFSYISKNLWKDDFWYFLHNYSTNYAFNDKLKNSLKVDKIVAKNLLSSLGYFTFDSVYTINLISFISKFNKDDILKNNVTFSKFIIDMHNFVDKDHFTNFYDKKYTSSTDKNIWGKHFWNFFHGFSLIYPESANFYMQNVAKSFILSIPYYLPCMECFLHSKDYIKKIVINNELDNIVENHSSLYDFLVNFHNNVNKRLGKKIV